ncbi:MULTISPECIES: hypothetical protein [Roseomonadaceae]|uniref:Uncharacterized protein n=1 Tax=Falsiroseomonas oleicola TaxID=2801474 RepID=A0ABS6H6K2_9PROT|nr:hypothetical protein [Roseomonas oleicola]MBU8544322.1 hypothetical protein [Roseomonas oleicola]
MPGTTFNALPLHLRGIVDFRIQGGRLHMVGPRDRHPHGPPSRSELLFIGDDRDGPNGSLGPAAFDGPRLRRWLASFGRGGGAVGVFGGAPDAAAYNSLCLFAVTLPRGAVIIECAVGTWLEWSRYIYSLAPDALRMDVVPGEIQAEAVRHMRAEGAFPVQMR